MLFQIPNDLNKCPVEIVTTTWPPFILPPPRSIDSLELEVSARVELNAGIEIKILKTISEKRNFMPVFQLDSHFYIYLLTAIKPLIHSLQSRRQGEMGNVS